MKNKTHLLLHTVQLCPKCQACLKISGTRNSRHESLESPRLVKVKPLKGHDLPSLAHQRFEFGLDDSDIFAITEEHSVMVVYR